MSEKAEIHGVCGCGVTATCPQCGRINPAHDIVECPRCHWTPPGQKSFGERLWDMASDEYRSFFDGIIFSKGVKDE